MSKVEKSVVEQIIVQRQASGLSQQEVSRRVGWKCNNQYFIERGNTRITIDLLNKYNELFEWEFDVKIVKN